METARHKLIETLFADAAEQPPAERARFLDNACNGDRELREQIDALLDADSSAGDFLDAPPFDRPSEPQPRPTPFDGGRRIGAYDVTRLIATGGMGTVFEARQDHPHRTVALKVMRSAVNSKEAQRRFRYEAELLGRLRHPHIAQIFEAGIHREGAADVPYFAMEFVPDATTLTEFAESRALDARARLALFIKVCDAVQHGHEKGVIHRDLKPANILVDASGEPKVIDFGVARATHHDVPLTTVQTNIGQLVGTLAYMSPEQIGGNPDDVDTRSDVYSLGVILYELLAGRRLFEVAGKPMLDAARAIADGEPAPLGTIDRGFKGDLDTIVQTALFREKSRRYASAADLAADIRRYLNDEPISARPPTTLYQLRKFARRNRALVVGTAIAAVGLVVGATAAVWKAVEATAERNHARQEAAKAERTLKFIQETLGEADPNRAPGDVTVRQALDVAARRAQADLADEPEVLASIEQMIGCIYVRVQRAYDGREHLMKALEIRKRIDGPDSIAVARILSDLAWVSNCDDPRKPEELFEESLRIHRQVYGPDHHLVACTMSYIASMKNIRKNFADAEPLGREALARLRAAHGDNHPSVSFAMKTYAISLAGIGRPAEAEPLFKQALQIDRTMLGPDHPELGITYSLYATFLDGQNRHVEAEAARAESKRISDLRIGSSTSPAGCKSQAQPARPAS